MKNKNSFWITNISNRNVSLSDLNVTIPPHSSVNLLSKNHHLTEEQLNKSLESGSLYLKRDKLFKRVVPPEVGKRKELPMDRDAIRSSLSTSIFEIKHEKYDDLEVSEDEMAEQNADTVTIDTQPLITKK